MKKPSTLFIKCLFGILFFLASFHQVNAQFLSDTIDIEHYNLHLRIMDFDQGILYGHAQMEMHAKMDGLNAFTLDLLKLQVDSAFFNAEEIMHTTNDTIIRMHLPEAPVAGETFTIDIYYHGQPNVEPYGWGGFHFNSGIAYNLGVAFDDYPHNYGRVWYPCIDDFVDRAFYDFYITAEEEHTAVCTGHLISVDDNGDGSKTWHWSTEHTLPSYLTSVAVSDYILLRQDFEGMEANIPMDLYVYQNDSLQALQSFRNLPQIMEGFESHWGPYPFERVGYVSTPKGAMEHATNIAYPTACIDGGLTYEYLYAHELSHMWFGDKVTCATAEDMWLNEGWAVFNEYLTQEVLYGKNAYQQYYLDKKADVLQYCHATDGGYYAVSGIPQAITYGETVYQKGALVVHSLRNYMGDAAFFPAVRHYLNKFAYDHASSWDLRDALEENSGIDLNGFFDSWVFNPGFAQFSVDSMHVSPNGAHFETEVFLKQRLKGTQQFYTDNRVMLRFVNENHHFQDVVMEMDGQTDSQVFTLPIDPEFVLVNAGDLLADAVTRAHKTIRNTGTFVFEHTFCSLEVLEKSDSAFVSVAHNWVAPDPFKNPVQGVRLSDYRYWTIKGDFDDKLDVTGKFKYSRTGYLDNTLLTNPEDSIMMLYRRNAADDWHSIESNQFGPFNVGFIYVPHLKAGEYTLAVCSPVFVDVPENEQPEIKVFPNPSGGSFYIENLSPGSWEIIDLNGRRLQRGRLENDMLQLRIDNKGLYYFRLMDNETGQTTTKKILIN